jgi:hypothetical protein
MSEQEMKDLLSSIEKGADRYKDSLNRALDVSRFNNSKTEDNINQFIKDFEDATDRLQARFDDDQSASGLVETVLNRAALIHNFMVRNQLTVRAQEDWARLRGKLDQLALAYHVRWNWLGGMTQPYRVNDKEIEKTLNNLETRADRFRRSLDAALDHSPLDGTNTEDAINRLVKDFEAATDHLKDRFDKKQSASADVEEVLRWAGRIDAFMRRHQLTVTAQNDWSHLRQGLDELAMGYQVVWDW